MRLESRAPRISSRPYRRSPARLRTSAFTDATHRHGTSAVEALPSASTTCTPTTSCESGLTRCESSQNKPSRRTHSSTTTPPARTDEAGEWRRPQRTRSNYSRCCRRRRFPGTGLRSEERRGGEECRFRWSAHHLKKKKIG